MNVHYVDPTAIVLDERYLCLAHAGPQYTGYIGSHFFADGRCTCPLFGYDLQNILNAVHVYPWTEGVSIDWRHEDAPRVFVPEPKPVRATPVVAQPVVPVVLEPLPMELHNEDPTPAPEPLPEKRKPGRPRKVY